MKTRSSRRPGQPEETAPTDQDKPLARQASLEQVLAVIIENPRAGSEEPESDSEAELNPGAKSAYFHRSLAKIKEEGLRPTYPLGAFCIFLQERRRELIDQHTPSKFYSSSHLRHEWRKLADKTRYQVEARGHYKEYKQLMRIWHRRAESSPAEPSKPATRKPKPEAAKNREAVQNENNSRGSASSRRGSDHELHRLTQVHFQDSSKEAPTQSENPPMNPAPPETAEGEIPRPLPRLVNSDEPTPFPMKELPLSQSMESYLHQNRIHARPFQAFQKRQFLPVPRLHQLVAPPVFGRARPNFTFKIQENGVPHLQSKLQSRRIACFNPAPAERTFDPGYAAYDIGKSLEKPHISRSPAWSSFRASPFPPTSVSGKPPSDAVLFDRLVRMSTEPANWLQAHLN